MKSDAPKKESKSAKSYAPDTTARWQCEVMIKEMKVGEVIAYKGALIFLNATDADAQAAQGNVRKLRPVVG